jgi:hypothetical protein
VRVVLVKILAIEPLGGHRLRVSFSDGSIGVHDFGSLVAEGGPMIEPLHDPAFFSRAVVEMGVPTWPSGFQIDAVKLHMDMAAADELNRDAAE